MILRVLFDILVLVLAYLVMCAAAILVIGSTRARSRRRRVRNIDRIVARETAHLDRSYRDLCHRTDH